MLLKGEPPAPPFWLQLEGLALTAEVRPNRHLISTNYDLALGQFSCPLAGVRGINSTGLPQSSPPHKGTKQIGMGEDKSEEIRTRASTTKGDNWCQSWRRPRRSTKPHWRVKSSGGLVGRSSEVLRQSVFLSVDSTASRVRAQHGEAQRQ
jgi:hypothetical protein